MSGLAIVLCAVLFGSAANSMDVNAPNLNYAPESQTLTDRLAIEVITINLENDYNMVHVLKMVDSIYSTFIRILMTNGIDDEHPNIIDLNTHKTRIDYVGKNIIVKTEKSINNELENIKKLIECLKKYNEPTVNQLTAQQCDTYLGALSTGEAQSKTEEKIIEIKQQIYIHDFEDVAQNQFSHQVVLENFRQLLKYCEADLRYKFFADVLFDIQKAEIVVETEIEKVHKSQHNSLAKNLMDIDDETYEQNLNEDSEIEKVTNSFILAADEIEMENMKNIFSILTKVNRRYFEYFEKAEGVYVDVDEEHSRALTAHANGVHIIIDTAACIKKNLKNYMRVFKAVINTKDSKKLENLTKIYHGNVKAGEVDLTDQNSVIKKLRIQVLQDSIVASIRKKLPPRIMENLKKIFWHCECERRNTFYFEVSNL